MTSRIEQDNGQSLILSRGAAYAYPPEDQRHDVEALPLSGRGRACVTRNGKGATHVCSISFEGEQGTMVTDAWCRQLGGGVTPLSQKGTPSPLIDFLGQPERPGSLLGRRIEGLRAIGGGGRRKSGK
jgi:hypothetical protein